MKRVPIAAVSALLWSCAAPAQDQATTLLAAARRADVVVRATVTAATDPSPEWHRLQFTAAEVLKGSIGGQFVLLEPAGACCGRSLFALQVGDRRLLFLERRGAALHPFGGSRGVVADEPAVVAHVAALLAAEHDDAAAALLAGALAHEEPRIADDAAHALAAMPRLHLPPPARAAVIAALQADVQRGATRAASLADVAVRVADAPLLDALLPTYLDAARADQATLLRRALGRCDPAEVVVRLPQFVADDARALRAAELLLDLPATAAAPALERLLQAHPHPRVQLRVAEGLLAAGRSRSQLTGRVPAPVLDVAARRHESPRRFRAIDPERR